MGITIIIREGKSDRRERLYGRLSRNPNLAEKAAAIAHNMEEAVDIRYHELRDKEDAKPIICEGGPEHKQAFIDDMKRIGQDPERVERDWKKAGIKVG